MLYIRIFVHNYYFAHLINLFMNLILIFNFKLNSIYIHTTYKYNIFIYHIFIYLFIIRYFIYVIKYNYHM